MVRKSSIFLICCISVCSVYAGFTELDIGRKIVALQNKSGRGLIEGEVYTITQVHTDFHASINSTGVGIHFGHQDLQWNFFHDYNINQQFIECISFASGISLFLVFAKGFNSSLGIT